MGLKVCATTAWPQEPIFIPRRDRIFVKDIYSRAVILNWTVYPSTVTFNNVWRRFWLSGVCVMCLYICVSVCVCIFVFLNDYIFVCLCVYAFVYMCVCVYISLFVHVYVYVYLCVFMPLC